MRKLASIAGIAVAGLGLQTAAYGYATTADLTFSWGTGGTEKGWTASAANSLATMSNSQYFTSLTGTNSTAYYNSDFAVAGFDVSCATTRKYGCRDASSSFIPSAITGSGPGASATGTLTVTDTTLTGTLTIVSTTDQPTGGTANSVGSGTNGYNLRSADGSPFGNSWNGVTTLGTYAVNLTGTFTETAWDINGGSARFTDAGFLCQQGGVGTTLCNVSITPGGFQANGGALTWGWDPDGNGAGTVATGIEVRDQSNAVITTLSGVLASLSIDGLGNVTTNTGEIRRGFGAGAGCGGLNTTQQNVTYNTSTSSVSCGTITTAGLVITGQTAVVPAPAAVWLLGTGIVALAARRRFKKAA